MAPLSQASALAIARLRAYRPPPSVYSTLPLSRRAGVLLLLFADRHGDLRVVLTLRASNMNSYAGQVSLPGGRADFETESAFQTARREAEEEIGLPRNKLPRPYEVEHLCELNTHLAITEAGVRPCVALLHSGTDDSKAADIEANMIPRLNSKEVAAIFSAPFHKFLSDGRDDPPPTSGSKRKPWYDGVWNDNHWRMHNFYIPRDQQVSGDASDETYRVFGLTAAILVGAARIAYSEEPQFEYRKEIGDEAVIKAFLDVGKFKDRKVKGGTLTKEDFKTAYATAYRARNKM